MTAILRNLRNTLYETVPKTNRERSESCENKIALRNYDLKITRQQHVCYAGSRKRTLRDATVSNRRQIPASYHRKPRGRTSLPVPHALPEYGQLTQKGMFPYYPAKTEKACPVMIKWGSHRKLESVVLELDALDT